MRVALATVVAVAAGAELTYFALAGQYSPMMWSALFFCLGVLSGWLTWPEV